MHAREITRGGGAETFFFFWGQRAVREVGTGITCTHHESQKGGEASHRDVVVRSTGETRAALLLAGAEWIQ
jgi:hypothetical protein